MAVLRAAVCATVAAVVLGCQAATPQFTEQDEAWVRSMFDSVVTDVRAANWTVWAARFTDDAQFHPSHAPVLNGRAAIQAWAEGLPPIENLGMANVQVAGEGNLAYGTSAVLFDYPDLPPDTAKQLVVFRREADGAWKVAAVSVTSDLPLPQPGPPTTPR